MSEPLTTTQLLTGLKAAGEVTRLRLLGLLHQGEFNVKDLTRILGQSQPRISRHLKLLTQAGLVERFREGSWVFFRLAEHGGAAILARRVVEAIDPDDPALARDREHARAVLFERAEVAQSYFRQHAPEWDRIRTLHVAEDQVEQAMRDALGSGPFDLMVDLGTGTGRILELFSDRIRRGVGLDLNHDMLAYARSKFDAARLEHCRVRQGDLFNIPLEKAEADAVVLHQVLHFLTDPPRAIREAARILKPGGKLLIVDFAPHDLEFLREEFAHQRLGFGAGQMRQWIEDAGLTAETHRELNPKRANGDAKLTVSLWLAGGPEQARAKSRARSGSLEAIDQ